MTLPDLAPRRAYGGVVAVWIVAAVVAVVIGVLAPADWRSAWMPVGLAGTVVLAFVIQLAPGRSQGFIERVAASALGALLVMGLIGLGFALASLVVV
jgi:hypothetical protein